MKFNRHSILGIWNIILAFIYMIDKIIEKGTIRPLGIILWIGLILSGIYIIYENAKSNRHP